MMILVYGGSGSGKSEFAENLCEKMPKKFYVATMSVNDAESILRIKKHQAQRASKNFITIEQSRNVGEAAEKITPESTVLLECLSNLVANEMFASPLQKSPDALTEKILSDIETLSSHCRNLVIVTNNIFDDGIEYDSTTRTYMDVLSKINCALAARAEKAYEVVAGIPLELK